MAKEQRLWMLKAYGRFRTTGYVLYEDAESQIATENQEGKNAVKGKWENIQDDNTFSLRLSLEQPGRLLITHGNTVLENLLLVDAGDWLKGICKLDCLLLVHKVNKASRLFRVQFREAVLAEGVTETSCEACVNQLSKYFPVRMKDSSDASGVNSADITSRPSISQLTSAILGNQTNYLPLLYQHCNYNPSNNDLENSVTTCLTDPNFPAFVGHVEKAIENIKSNC